MPCFGQGKDKYSYKEPREVQADMTRFMCTVQERHDRKRLDWDWWMDSDENSTHLSFAFVWSWWFLLLQCMLQLKKKTRALPSGGKGKCTTILFGTLGSEESVAWAYGIEEQQKRWAGRLVRDTRQVTNHSGVHHLFSWTQVRAVESPIQEFLADLPCCASACYITLSEPSLFFSQASHLRWLATLPLPT